ncbi:MAG TPA: NADH-quinone oxidoreductase subunit C [Terriglobia bacterium]|nr:NADH-quinone oxidoreductase subunit C [Terriglobia bacterium]
MADLIEMTRQAEERWPGLVQSWVDRRKPAAELRCSRSEILPDVARWLASDLGYRFAGFVVEEQPKEWEIRYLFYHPRVTGWVYVLLQQALEVRAIPSISSQVHAADWQEREVEDLFGITFEGHPRLGDFVLHDDLWQEDVAPMRRDFDEETALAERKPRPDWRPRRIVENPGAFVMPVGPIYSGVTESVLFLLETVGEDVIRAFPRLFYKYRGIEKIAEGRTVEDCLLLAERFAATTAFAHALAYCQAVESICRVQVPERARWLRVLLAELERVRHHAGVIQEICESTALSVAASQAALLEEDLLRISGGFAGHRYLFGLAVPGGLTVDPGDPACLRVVDEVRQTVRQLNELEQRLRFSSSFLDRLEGVGFIPAQEAQDHGLVGPIARASGTDGDLRKSQPYCGYDQLRFDVPVETEGDGFARLRVFFAEARQSVQIMQQIPVRLNAGAVQAPVAYQSGVALGWVEAPRGATFHWVRLGREGVIERYRLITPSFVNWHGFHLAAENFAFQDFPIILASLGLSVAENDR